jgi:DNA (cytosine-5)-methyltransferase 1
MKFRVLSLFSGIGALDLGLEKTRFFETVGFCEIEEWPRNVLKKHWPSVPCFDDIKHLTGENVIRQLGYVDVICGGFPCQDISSAGLGAGLNGKESSLWFEYLRLINEIRPKYVIIENSSFLRNRGLGKVLEGLASIGYDAEWYRLRACDFGAPHRRARTWIIAYPIGNIQPREEPRCGAIGRVGRQQQSFPWDTAWPEKVAEFRGVDNGTTNRVDRFDTIRNAVVPQIAEEIGNLIAQWEQKNENL